MAQLQREREVAEDALGRLQEEENGLALALKRHRGSPTEAQEQLDQLTVVEGESDAPNEEDEDEIEKFANLPRTDAVFLVLSEHPRGMSPAEVRDELHGRGRDDEYKLVASALSYLKDRGRVTSPRRGHYRVVAATQEEASA